MFNVWDKILKQKKIVLFAVLFFIISGIFLPNTTSAFNRGPQTVCGLSMPGTGSGSTALSKALITAFTTALSFIPGVGPLLSPAAQVAPVIAPKTIGSGDLGSCIILTIAFLGDGYIYVGEHFGYLSSYTLNSVVGELMRDDDGRWSITRNTSILGSVFYDIWLITKKWANLLIVLGLIGVALAFILNLDQYKKLLVPLLIVALLVNFSVVFVGLMIDASTIVINSFLQGGGSEEISNLIFRINVAWNNSMEQFLVDSFLSALIYLSLSMVFFIIYIMVAITLFIFAIIFMERYVFLAILFVFSPLAFVFRIFPIAQAKKLWDDWWSHFLKWCFVGLIGAFFLNLATELIKAMGDRISIVYDVEPERILSHLSIMLFYLLIVIIFLLVGIWLTLKSAGTASVMVIAASTAAVGALAGFAAGGGARGAGIGAGIGKKLGKGDIRGAGGELAGAFASSRTGAGLSYYGTKIGERFGLAQKGSAEQRWQNAMQERLKEPTERLKSIRDTKILGQIAATGRDRIERAAATNILKERDSLSDIPAAYRERAMMNAMAHDNKLKQSDFSKSDYRYGEFDKKASDRIRAANPGFSETQVRQTTRQEQLETNLASMSPEARRNIDLDDLTPDLIVSRNFNANMVRNFRTADRNHIQKLRNRVVYAELTSRIRAATAAGNKGEASRLKNILNEIRDLPHGPGGGAPGPGAGTGGGGGGPTGGGGGSASPPGSGGVGGGGGSASPPGSGGVGGGGGGTPGPGAGTGGGGGGPTGTGPTGSSDAGATSGNPTDGSGSRPAGPGGAASGVGTGARAGGGNGSKKGPVGNYYTKAYKDFGLTQGSSVDDIKRAYRGLVKQYHPDVYVGDKKEGMRKFKEIQEDFEKLTK